MRVPGRRLETLTLAFVAGAVACVPQGDPPAGRHIVADRVSRPVGFVQPNGDGITRVLLTRPDRDTYGADLWVVSVDATIAPPVERLLAQNASFGGSQTQVYGNGNCGGTDGRGRLLVGTNEGGRFNLARIDPITGDRLDLGEIKTCLLSASGQRLLALAQVQTATLYEPDDQVIPLDAWTGSFVGEDLYYVDTQRDLMRLPPDGPVELVATNVDEVGTPIQTDAGPALLLTRVKTTDPLVSDWSLLDVSTGRETALPSLSNGFSMSSDGRWFATFDRNTGASTFVDARTGNQEPIALPDGPSNQPTWRPGHDEAWFLASSSAQPLLSIRRPGGFSLDLPLAATDAQDDRGINSIFTADGASWFSWPVAQGDASVVLVGDADDPTGPTWPVAPPATLRTTYSLLADGRILTPTWTSSPERNNLYAVDPRTGDTRVLGEEGELLAVGQTRLLVNQHVIEHEGDLAVVQLTGEQTVLAPEFTVTAAVAPRGADRVAPGAPVAFSFVARFPSDDDGVWLATVP